MPSCLASSHRTAAADTSGDDLLGWAALLAGLAHCRLETLVLAATGLGPAALKLLALGWTAYARDRLNLLERRRPPQEGTGRAAAKSSCHLDWRAT